MKRITSLLTAAVIAISPVFTTPLLDASAELGGFASAGSFYDMGYDFQPGLWSLRINIPGTQEQEGYLILNEDDSGKVIEAHRGDSYRIILSKIGKVANLRYEGGSESYFYDVTEKGDDVYELKLRDDNITITMKLIDKDERENTLVIHTLSELGNLAFQHYKNAHEGYVPDTINSYIDDDGMAVIQLCEMKTEHMVVVDAYSVDPRSCVGQDISGNYIDIRTVCRDGSFFRPGIWLAESEGFKYAPTYYYFYENNAEGAMVDQHTGETVLFKYSIDGNKLIIEPETEEKETIVYEVEKFSDFVFFAIDADGSSQSFSYIGYDYFGKTRIYNDKEIENMMSALCSEVCGTLPQNVDVLTTDTGFVSANAYDMIDDKVSPIGHMSVDRFSGWGYADDGSKIKMSDYLDYPAVIRSGVWETYGTLNTDFKAGFLVIENEHEGYHINGASGTVKRFTWVRTGNTCVFKDKESGEEIPMYISVLGNRMELSYVNGGSDSVKLNYLGNISYKNFNFHGTEELAYFATQHYRSKTGYEGEIFNTLDHTDDHFFTVEIIADNKTVETYYIDKFSALAQLSDGAIVNVLEKTAPQPTAKVGDINNDSLIDSADASEVLSIYANVSTGGSAETDPLKNTAADVNKDGLVDSNDASLILAYYAYVSTSSGDDVKDITAFIDPEG